MFNQGKSLTPEVKYVVVRLKTFFDSHKKAFPSELRSTQLTADAIGISIASVDRIMASYRKNPESIKSELNIKGRPKYALSSENEGIVRAYIREANIQGSYITLESIRDFLKEKNPEGDFHISTLSRALDRWGFEFGKGSRTQHLKEKDEVIVARQRYLRIIRNNRCNKSISKTRRTEIYLDESYVNKNHSNDYIWYSHDDGPWVTKPTGKGERLIILNAISRDGWVPNAKLVFKSTRKTGDYHGQMNSEMFLKWFSEQLIPNIPENSIIVMDNAPYHNVLAEISPPLPKSSKKAIYEWLSIKGFPCSHDCLKVELVEILKQLNPTPIYKVDEIAREQGHIIVRTPPYHPELQPIELCWGIVKNEVARNCDFTMTNLYNQLERGFEEVTPTTCKRVIQKIRRIEDKFWEEDAEMDKENELKVEGFCIDTNPKK